MEAEAGDWDGLQPGGRVRLASGQQPSAMDLVGCVEQLVSGCCGGQCVPGALLGSVRGGWEFLDSSFRLEELHCRL